MKSQTAVASGLPAACLGTVPPLLLCVCMHSDVKKLRCWQAINFLLLRDLRYFRPRGSLGHSLASVTSSFPTRVRTPSYCNIFCNLLQLLFVFCRCCTRTRCPAEPLDSAWRAASEFRSLKPPPHPKPPSEFPSSCRLHIPLSSSDYFILNLYPTCSFHSEM